MWGSSTYWEKGFFVSECLCLSPSSTSDNYFPSQPSADNLCVKPLSSFFIVLFVKGRKKKGQQLQVCISAAALFHCFECDHEVHKLEMASNCSRLLRLLRLIFINFICCILLDRTTQNYTAFILMFVVLYLLQGHHSKNHKAISISTRQGKHLACNAQIWITNQFT